MFETTNIYAVESYSKHDKTFHRYSIGALDDMKSLLDTLVACSVENSDCDKYYRIVELSEKDVDTWNNQVEHVTTMANVDKIFGEWVNIDVAAKYLDITFGRVFQLIQAGEFRTKVVGRNRLVNVEDVVNRKIVSPCSGRRFQKSYLKMQEEKNKEAYQSEIDIPDQEQPCE